MGRQCARDPLHVRLVAVGGLAVLLSLAAATPATAADLFPPPTRGDGLSFWQDWQFDTNANPCVPEVHDNPHGIPYASITVGDFGEGWIDQWGGLGNPDGYWDLGREGTIEATIPNDTTLSAQELWVQVTYFDDLTQEPVVTVTGADPISSQTAVAESVPTGGKWMVHQSIWWVSPSQNTNDVVVTADYWGSVVEEFIVDVVPIPTLVALSEFGTRIDGGGVDVFWRTGDEMDAAGFWLERLAEETGEYVRVNEELIPAGDPGGAYEVVDPAAVPGEMSTYRIVELQTNGLHRLYGAFTVIAGGPSQTFEDWRDTFFTEADLADPAISGLEADCDLDGFTTRAEFAAGTDPTDRGSMLRFTHVDRSDVGGVRLEWASVAGRTYCVEQLTGPGGDYEPVLHGITATAPRNVQEIEDDGVVARWYRVRVEP